MTDLELIEKYGKDNLPGFYDDYLIPIGPFLEEWSKIENATIDYYVSNYGRVKSYKRYSKKYVFLKKSLNNSGYPQFSMSIIQDGIIKKKQFRVHRMVAIHFLKTEPKESVNHKNGIKDDNFVTNLEWNTVGENVRHAFRNKLIIQPKGDSHHLSKPIYQFDRNGNLIKKWGCVLLASETLKIHRWNMYEVALGTNPIRKTAGGFIWKFNK